MLVALAAGKTRGHEAHPRHRDAVRKAGWIALDELCVPPPVTVDVDDVGGAEADFWSRH